MGETFSVPDVAAAVSKLVPVQLVAFALLQVSALEPPSGSVRKSAPRLAVTAGPMVMVCWAGALVAPPTPLHATE